MDEQKILQRYWCCRGCCDAVKSRTIFSRYYYRNNRAHIGQDYWTEGMRIHGVRGTGISRPTPPPPAATVCRGTSRRPGKTTQAAGRAVSGGVLAGNWRIEELDYPMGDRSEPGVRMCQRPRGLKRTKGGNYEESRVGHGLARGLQREGSYPTAII